jgi:hypothetical protein
VGSAPEVELEAAAAAEAAALLLCLLLLPQPPEIPCDVVAAFAAMVAPELLLELALEERPLAVVARTIMSELDLTLTTLRCVRKRRGEHQTSPHSK